MFKSSSQPPRYSVKQIYFALLAFTGFVSFIVLVDEVLLTATILTMGLALFFSIGASWLFLILLVFLPAVILKGKQQTIALFVGLFIILAAVYSGSISAYFLANKFLPPTTYNAADISKPISILLPPQDKNGCNTFCKSLLMGGDIEQVQVSSDVFYKSVPNESCREFDVTYPAGTPCIVVSDTPISSTTGSWQIHTTYQTYSAEDRNYLFVPMKSETLQILEGEKIRWQHSSLKYDVFLLLPMLTFVEGRPTSAKYELYRSSGSTEKHSIVDGLEGLGIRLVQPIPSNTGNIISDYEQKTSDSLSLDAIIVASAMSADMSSGNVHVAADLSRYMSSLSLKSNLSALDRNLISTVASNPNLSGFPGLCQALTTAPDVANQSIDIDELFRRASNGFTDEARHASITLSNRLVSAEPEAYASKADAYIAIIDKGFGNFHPSLIKSVGRMGFDPTPYLKVWLHGERTKGRDILHAACLSGPQWDEQVVKVARDYLELYKHKAGGGPDARNALNILATRGHISEVETWIKEVRTPDYLEPKMFWKLVLNSIFGSSKIEAWRQKLRADTIENIGCSY